MDDTDRGRRGAGGQMDPLAQYCVIVMGEIRAFLMLKESLIFCVGNKTDSEAQKIQSKRDFGHFI